MKKQVIILGAGISGLSLAWFLRRRFGKKIGITILEKSDRAGGWIRTNRETGFIFEQGPRSCRTKGSGIETLNLIKQLNLQHRVIGADRSSHYRYIRSDQKFRMVPSGLFSMISSPWLYRIVPAIFRDLFSSKSRNPDESIYDFVSRRFSRTIAEDLIDPFASGIFAGDIRKLSVKSCFPQLYEWEQSSGSVLRGMLQERKNRSRSSNAFIQKMQKVSLFTLKEGMEELTEELEAQLGEHLQLSTDPVSLRCYPYHAEVQLSNGQVLDADHIYTTIPSKALAHYFAPYHQELVDILNGIPTSSIASVNLGYHRKVLKKKGFGYLIPSHEKQKILGMVWDSCVFPQQNQIPEETRLTVMIGGSHFSNFDHHNENDFLQIALAAVEDHLGIHLQPAAFNVTIARNAIPQYCIGHSAKVAKAEEVLSRIFPRLTLHGSSFHGLSVNDCIANSKRLEELF